MALGDYRILRENAVGSFDETFLPSHLWGLGSPDLYSDGISQHCTNDANLAILTGFYAIDTYLGNNVINTPSGCSWGYCIVMSEGAWVNQMFIDPGYGRIYLRNLNENVWSDWLYQHNNGEDLYIDLVNHRVGVGTIVPQSPLHVKGIMTLENSTDTTVCTLALTNPYYNRLTYAIPPKNSKSEVKYVTRGATAGTGQTYFVIASTEIGDIGDNLLMGVSSGRAFITNATDYQRAGALHLGGTSYTTDGAMVITPSGNVGIGTATAGTSLVVAQKTTGYGTVTTNGTTTLTGLSTEFLNTFKVGNTINVFGETVRTIATIVSNTSLTVTVAFSTSGSAKTYTLAGGTRLAVFGNGNVAIGGISPTALLHIKAGTAIAGTAPLKLTSGVNLTVAEAGTFEFDGTNLYFTPVATRKTISFTDTPPPDTSVTYAKLANEFKTAATVTSTVNLSANAIGNITLSANTAFTFTNFQLGKFYRLVITANGFTPSFAVAGRHVLVTGNETLGTSGVFYIGLECIDATSGSEKLLTTIMKGA